MLAIYKRELQSYMRSFIGFLFIGASLFFLGFYFSYFNLQNKSPYFAYALASVIVFFLLSVPILTMRVLAEEKRNRTDQLILTAPVSVGGIVLGKFLALLTIFAIPSAIACVYPLIMSRYGSIPMGQSYLAVLAYFLYGMAAIAIGVFISSLVESQMIAAVFTLVVLLVFYMMSTLCGIISTTGNALTRILSCFDLYTPFANLLNGTLNIASVVYFLSVTALALFFTVQSIQKRRYTVSVKNLSMGAYSVGMIVIALVIVMVINIILGEMPPTWTNIDISSSRLYSLTDQTKEYVRGMQDDVSIYVLTNEASRDDTLGQTLDRYDALSDHITVTYVDPNVNPSFFTKYTSASVTVNSVIVESAKRSVVLDYNDFYETSTTLDYENFTYVTEATGYDGEGLITSALDYVLSDDIKKIYVIDGHNEYEITTSLDAALDKANIEYEVISLMDYDAVPQNASGILINAPASDLSAEDAAKVQEYLNGGGNVILVAGYAQEGQDTPNLNGILEDMGLSLAEGVVVEQDASRYSGLPYLLLPVKSESKYLEGIYSDSFSYVFAPFARGIQIADKNAENLTYHTFLSTSDTAFSRISNEVTENFDKEEGDIDGPFGIGVEAVKTLDEDRKATLVLFSSPEIFTDTASEYVSGTNQTLFTNTVSAFADKESNVSIPIKSYEISSYLAITARDALVLTVITVAVLPLAFLIAGFVIWMRRRRRK